MRAENRAGPRLRLRLLPAIGDREEVPPAKNAQNQDKVGQTRPFCVFAAENASYFWGGNMPNRDQSRRKAEQTAPAGPILEIGRQPFLIDKRGVIAGIFRSVLTKKQGRGCPAAQVAAVISADN